MIDVKDLFDILDLTTDEIDELFDVATKLLKKNKADYIVANLLDRIGNGKHFAMIIDENGILKRCETKSEIATSIAKLIFN